MTVQYRQPVHRLYPLPTGDLRGTFLVSEPVIDATRGALISFAKVGRKDGGHEGLVYWCGREVGAVTLFVHALVPDVDHGPQHVLVSKAAVGRAARHARNLKLGLLCQVHSHPGDDARHSDGDDKLILLPFDGMLSVVLPHFGREFRSMTDACVHQYQNGRWILCSRASVDAQLVVVPAFADLR
jgi:hypothetical protein